MSPSSSVHANRSFHRWSHTTTGRRFVQALIVLLTLQGWPLQELSRSYRWQPPAWLGVVGSGLSQFNQGATQWLGQLSADAHGNAARITTITPSCAGPGDTVVITGRLCPKLPVKRGA